MGLTALIARVSVLPLCTRGKLSFQRATPPLAPSRCFPPRDLWGKNSGAEDLSSRWQASSRRLNARVPRYHQRESIRLSSSPKTISVPLRLRATWSRSVWVRINWMTAFLWRLQMRKSYWALWLTPPSCRHLLHATPDSERKKSSSALWRRLSTSSASNGLLLRSHLAAGQVVSSGAPSGGAPSEGPPLAKARCDPRHKCTEGRLSRETLPKRVGERCARANRPSAFDLKRSRAYTSTA